jgi:hypothetical protein
MNRSSSCLWNLTALPGPAGFSRSSRTARHKVTELILVYFAASSYVRYGHCTSAVSIALGLSLTYSRLQSTEAQGYLGWLKARKRLDFHEGENLVEDRENFIRARDNETHDGYLGTGWIAFRDFDRVEETEHNVRLLAKWRDPGLPQFSKGGSEATRVNGCQGQQRA